MSYHMSKVLNMRISRSKVDLFIECPLCFWLDQKAMIKRPSGPPFSLNVAVDHLFKNEFDLSRGKGVPARLAKEGLSFIPAAHPKLGQWRENFKGVTRQFGDIEFFGAIDDLWVDMFGVHYVVDYKATSKADEVSLDADWQISYKRQVEFYQWLLRGNDLEVSNQAWFVYTNGIKDDTPFNDVLRFRTKLLSYDGDGSWIEPTLKSLIACLNSDTPPQCKEACAYCQFIGKRVSKNESSVLDPKPIKIDHRIPKSAVKSANQNAESSFAIELLQATVDKRLMIDELVVQVIKANSRRVTLANKKRVLEVVFGLQQAGVLRLENGVAILI
jgi:uncharacterized protein YneR